MRDGLLPIAGEKSGLVTFKQVWGNWPSQPNLKLTITWRGNAVMDMEPRGKGLPIDFANLKPLPAIAE
jgi:hypothetical protein